MQTKQKHENIKAKNTKFNCPLWMIFSKYASNQITFGLRETSGWIEQDMVQQKRQRNDRKKIIKEKIRIIKFK